MAKDRHQRAEGEAHGRNLLLTRETALKALAQLREAMAERDRLIEELALLGYARRDSPDRSRLSSQTEQVKFTVGTELRALAVTRRIDDRPPNGPRAR